MILREKYLERIIPFIDAPFIKILTGVRGCGTTTLLRMLQQEIENRGTPKSRILFYSFDMYKSDSLKSALKLYQDIKSKISDNGKTYIFLDEVQEVEDWEKTVNSISSSFDVDLYVVCSNSTNLYEDLSPNLIGKYIQFKVYPLSFEEFLKFHKSKSTVKDLYSEFTNFAQIGGLPFVNTIDCPIESTYQTLRDTLNSIIYTDILRKNRVRKADVFCVATKKILNQIGLPFSVLELSEYLNSRSIMADYENLNNFIYLLQKAGIIHYCQRYDLKEQNIIKYGGKFYIADHSYLSALEDNYSHISERLISNMVYIELKRRGYEVWSGKHGKAEIDFVGFRQNQKIYVQIESNLEGDKSGTLAANQLLEINDSYPKYFLTTEPSQVIQRDGIQSMHIADFLLSDLF